MPKFEEEQLKFLIELISELKIGSGNLEFETKDGGSCRYNIPLSEIIVKNYIGDKLLEKLKQEFKIRIDNGVYKIRELIEDGKDIADSLSIRPKELGSKLFLSFLLNNDEKKELVEEIINQYLSKCKEYKRADFDEIPTDKELLELLE